MSRKFNKGGSDGEAFATFSSCISFDFPSAISKSRSASLTCNWRRGSPCAQRYHDGEDGLGASACNTDNRSKADFNEA
jgi:hypothetical protein